MRGWLVGLTVAVLLTVVGAVALIAVVVGSASTVAIVDLAVGDCFDLPPDDELGRFETVELIECDDSHQVEVVAVAELNPDGDAAYPPDAELFPLAQRRCGAAAAAVPIDRFAIVPLAPTEDTWNGAVGRLACLALAIGGDATTGSVAGDG